jgi:hypothetical protein
VTEVYESNQLWGGFLIFNLEDRDAVFDAYLNFVDNTANDPSSQIIISTQFANNQRFLSSVMSNIDAISLPPAFDEFAAIGNISSSLATGPIAEFVPQFTGPTPLGL